MGFARDIHALLGADDEEIFEDTSTGVIVLGYDGLPMHPVALPSPDYIPARIAQTPPVPQDEDEREPMFVQAHDPDCVPKPIYPEYIPLEDEHEFPTEEQPLPPDDEEEEEEEEEEHLALADSAIVVPVDEPVFPPEGTEPVIPPPSTDITIRARITVRPQTSISLLLEAEVKRLLAMTTPSPSPPISLSPPSAKERLTLRIAFTQALIDAVTAALPSLPLPPSLYIPPPVDRSRYKVGESSTARPTRGRGIDYRFVSTVDAEERRQGIRDVGYGIRDTLVDPAEVVPEITPMTVGEVNTRVTELAELHEHDTQDLYALLEDAQDRDSMDGGGGGLCFPRGLGSLDRIESGDSSGASDPSRQAQMVETLRVIRDMRREMSDMQAELLSLREQQRRARQPGPEARIPDHQDASGDADSHI
ncbi:hypothetical protein Tco_0798234 [Tanacetum coccineum]